MHSPRREMHYFWGKCIPGSVLTALLVTMCELSPSLPTYFFLRGKSAPPMDSMSTRGWYGEGHFPTVYGTFSYEGDRVPTQVIEMLRSACWRSPC
jgi:hypothetical protein